MGNFGIQYGYLIGTLILGIVWLLFYLIRKDLRKELLWLSSIFAIAGVTERFFVPIYWSPGSLFDLINIIGFGIESFAFSFFAAGLAGITYELLARKHLRKGHFTRTHSRLFPIITFFGLLIFMIHKDMNIHLYSLIVPSVIVAIIIGLYRKDLIREIVFGGIYFAFLYLVLFIVFYQIFPTYIKGTYNIENLWGIYIVRIPLEDILFAFAIGAMLGPLYEYTQGYRIYSYRKSQ